MRIRWTLPAADDLQNIKNYLQQNYPYYAEPTVRTIYQRIRLLKNSPDRGRLGHRSGTRELALTPLPYVVVYAVKAEAVEILHIYHGASRLGLTLFKFHKGSNLAGWRRHASFPHVCDFPKGRLLASHRLSERYWKQADPTRHSAR